MQKRQSKYLSFRNTTTELFSPRQCLVFRYACNHYFILFHAPFNNIRGITLHLHDDYEYLNRNDTEVNLSCMAQVLINTSLIVHFLAIMSTLAGIQM